MRTKRQPRRLAAIALVAGALLVAACGSEMNANRAGEELDQQTPAAQPAEPRSRDQADGEDALPQPQVQDRKVVRNATLDLHVENVTSAVQQIDDIAAGAGGFVSSSNVFVDTEDGDGDEVSRTQTARVTVRVPADAYSTVMAQLRGIADETVSESSDASEVTEEYTDLQARLRNLEATEQRYLELLNRAQSIDEILTVQDRLNPVRLEIEQVTGRMNVLNNLTDFATITINLGLPPAIAQADGRNWAEEAWHASWQTSKDAMVVFGTVAIVSAVLAAWLALPAIALLVLWRLFGRRIVDFARKLDQGVTNPPKP